MGGPGAPRSSVRIARRGTTRLNPSQGSVAATRIEARVERSLVLPGRVWAAERPRGLVGIVHGIGEHSARYTALAGDLVGAGLTVAALDWPGHGDAPGSRGDVRSWTWVRDHWVPALLSATQGMPGQPQELPRILFGHSMGGAMALDFALAHGREIAGVAASGPALRTAMPPWWKLVLANVALATAPSLGFSTGIDTGGISRDPEVNRLRQEDNLIHDVISPRLYAGFTEGRQRVLRDARRLSVPALVMHGAADRIVDPEGAREFAAAAPKSMVKLILYPDVYHEVFNDYGRERAVADLIGWLGSVIR